MNSSLADTYSKGAVKNILSLAIFWIANHFVLTNVYKEKSEWTLEHILGSIGITTVLAIAFLLLIFLVSIGGFLIGIIGTLGCLFGLAFLADKIVEIMNITYDTAELGISFIGIALNLVIIVRFILNIRNYRIVQYADKTNAISSDN